jgi:hypothetical protein
MEKTFEISADFNLEDGTEKVGFKRSLRTFSPFMMTGRFILAWVYDYVKAAGKRLTLLWN